MTAGWTRPSAAPIIVSASVSWKYLGPLCTRGLVLRARAHKRLGCKTSFGFCMNTPNTNNKQSFILSTTINILILCRWQRTWYVSRTGYLWGATSPTTTKCYRHIFLIWNRGFNIIRLLHNIFFIIYLIKC